jgi:hypothetical protein
MFDTFEQIVIESQIAQNEICQALMVTGLELAHYQSDNAKIFDLLRKFNHFSRIYPMTIRNSVHVSGN